MRLVILSDNTAGARGLIAEHGLALWIELGPYRILFDTGQGLALKHNAHVLGIDISTADAILLSHGHYDHTGGLEDVLASRSGARVLAHPAALLAKYAASGGTLREIGIPSAARKALRERAKLEPTDSPTLVADGAWVTGPIPRVTGFEEGNNAFFVDPAGRERDWIVDDQAAFLTTPRGTIVVLGCAHSGVVNTLYHVRTLTGGRPVRAVIGGMHLAAASSSRIELTVRTLREMDVAQVIPTHCTGLAATASMLGGLPGRVTAARTGDVFTFDEA